MREVTQEEAAQLRDALKTISGFLNPAATQDGGQEQRLVRFYAVAVFASFLGALTAMATISFRDRVWKWFAVNVAGVGAVSFVFAVNLARTDAVIALVMSLLISLLLWARWVRTGRPAEVVAAPREAGF